MHFEIIGEIEETETIGIGGRIRDIVRLQSGSMRKAELHWYEARGIGRKKMKIKRFLD